MNINLGNGYWLTDELQSVSNKRPEVTAGNTFIVKGEIKPVNYKHGDRKSELKAVQEITSDLWNEVSHLSDQTKGVLIKEVICRYFGLRYHESFPGIVKILDLSITNLYCPPDSAPRFQKPGYGALDFISDLVQEKASIFIDYTSSGDESDKTNYAYSDWLTVISTSGSIKRANINFYVKDDSDKIRQTRFIRDGEVTRSEIAVLTSSRLFGKFKRLGIVKRIIYSGSGKTAGVINLTGLSVTNQSTLKKVRTQGWRYSLSRVVSQYLVEDKVVKELKKHCPSDPKVTTQKDYSGRKKVIETSSSWFEVEFDIQVDFKKLLPLDISKFPEVLPDWIERRKETKKMVERKVFELITCHAEIGITPDSFIFVKTSPYQIEAKLKYIINKKNKK